MDHRERAGEAIRPPSGLHLRDAAIGDEIDARAVAALIRRKEDGGGRHFLRPADPPECAIEERDIRPCGVTPSPRSWRNDAALRWENTRPDGSTYNAGPSWDPNKGNGP
jgi:hypothetical protein